MEMDVEGKEGSLMKVEVSVEERDGFEGFSSEVEEEEEEEEEGGIVEEEGGGVRRSSSCFEFPTHYGNEFVEEVKEVEGGGGGGVWREIVGCLFPKLEGEEDEGTVEGVFVHRDDSDAAKKRVSVHNFLKVPLRLEALLALSVLICLDEFLTPFTTLPVRTCWSLRQRIRPRKNLETTTDEDIQTVVDCAHLSLLLITTMFLWSYNVSWVYHNIRGQNVIKLYVIFNIVEIFDRLLSSFGMDVFDMLGSSLAEAVRFFGIDRRRKRRSAGVTLLIRLGFDYLVSLVYSVVHATLILAWVMTLNVTVNSSGNTILVLLVSNNFVELKSVALKHFRVQSIFQIACSDAVERFQMFVFLSTILAYTRGDRRVLITWLVVFGFELVVDWIKHSFAAKFNNISHEAYKTFSLVLCRDLIASKKHSLTTSIGGTSVSKRLGFVSLPISAFTLRMLGSVIPSMPIISIVLMAMTLFLLKAALGIGLLGHCSRRVRRFRDKRSVDEDEGIMRQLAGVHRYTVRKDT